MPETTSLSIQPETKLAALFDAYPATEEILVHEIPMLARLRTPALRKTVGQTLSLEQAAQSAGVNLPTLVMRLREAAGVADRPDAPAGVHPSAPEWVKKGTIAKTLDARPLLAQGQHPKTMVLQELESLEPGQIFVLLTPFVPGPLIELGRAQSLATWTRQGEAGKFETYFGRVG